MHKRLFTPGPTEVRPEILQALSTPQIHHRSKEASDLYADLQSKLQKLLYTEKPILLFTSSSTGAMEAAVTNTVKKKCLNLVNGAFSGRWHKIAVMNGVPCETLEIEWDKPIKADIVDQKLSSNEFDAVTLVFNETSTGLMNPLEDIAEVIQKYPNVIFLVDAVSAMAGVKIEVDRLGIDICLAGVQKAFALPPGLTVASVSDRVLQRAEEVEPRSYYFNLPLMYKYHQKHQSPVTPATSLMFALNTQMNSILEEGIENRFIRHEKMSLYVQKWARKYFDIYPEKGYESRTLTCVRNTRKISVADLSEELGKHSVRISNGYGNLKEETFRIAHMGDTQIQDIIGLLGLIENILDL